jgi:choline dehydrogenase-like flavoprotein
MCAFILAAVAGLAAPAAAQGMAVDYIVVGAGTAGCTLAARLCEGLPDAQVLLLERGAPRTREQVRCLGLSWPSGLL